MKKYRFGASFGDFVVTEMKEYKSRRVEGQESARDYRRGGEYRGGVAGDTGGYGGAGGTVRGTAIV